MENKVNQAISIKTPDGLKLFLANNYMNQIKNFFGDEKQALKFLSSVMSSVQKNTKLLECEPMSVINSFMTMAQLGLMPSDISGEAFVLPYSVRGVMTAQFQLGYQGLVTLFYRAGGQSIRAEIVRRNDEFSNENGIIKHKIDIFKSNEERGEPIGAYAIAVFNGQELSKAMNKKDILAIGEKFSKSWATSFTPWKEVNDPNLWQWKKTVFKQLGKLLPKNETITKAIAADNEESDLEKPVKSLVGGSGLEMGNLLKDKNYDKDQDKSQETKASDSQEN
jgi:recombination protein RecT